MYPFTLERPSTLAAATQLAANGAKVLAGGQTLLAAMKLRLSQPGQLADLAGVKELSGICRDGNALVIGAMTRHMDVANHADVKALIPGLADLADHIGDRQVRAMGTLGRLGGQQRPGRLLPQRPARAGRHGAHHLTQNCS